MKKFTPVVLAAALAAPTLPAPATAWVSEAVRTDNLGSVEVRVTDGATGGCWTNIGEARTYAEDKLSELGYVIKDTHFYHIKFEISVTSERVNGGCYGVVMIELFAPAELSFAKGSVTGLLGRRSFTFIGHKNANTVVLDVIKNLVDEMMEDA